MLNRRQRLFAANNGGGNLRRQLLDGAPFLSELLHTAVPTRAAPGTTGTFTRATTKTVENTDGYLVTLLAGEIGFPGARRVYNALQNASIPSQDFSVAAWAASGVKSVTANYTTAPDGTTTADRVVIAAGDYLRANTNLGSSSNSKTWLGSVYVKATSGTQTFRILLTQNGVANNYSSDLVATSEWQRFSFSIPFTSGGSGFLCGIADKAAGGGTDLVVWGYQAEDVTAQTTQTAGEYVSVGVVQRNKVLYSSDFSGWTAVGTPTRTAAAHTSTGVVLDLIGDDSAGALEGYTQSITFTGDGTKSVSLYVKAGSSALSQFRILDVTAGTNRVNCAITWTAGVPSLSFFAGSQESVPELISDGVYRLKVVASGVVAANNNSLQIYPATNGLGVGETGNIYAGGVQAENNATATEYQAVGGSYIYHGSFVDGVKCYATDINGSPIPSSTLLGYQAQGARTNLCLQSNAFTTTWSQASTPTITQNAIGPDGATSAWTITDNAPAAIEGIFQPITLTAATHTVSVFIKKTVGATTFPILYSYTATGNLIAPVTVDTNNGVATAFSAYTGLTVASGLVASCVSFNSDFWRVSYSFTATAVSWGQCCAMFPAGTTNATQSTGTADVTLTGSAVFYGAQLELGSFASSYIATTTAAVTRNADVDAYSSAGNIDGTNGWCYFETSADWSANSGGSAIGLGTGSVAIIYMDGVKISFYDGVNADVEGNYVPSVGDKVCVTWGGTTSSIAVNGVVLDTGTFTAFTPDANVFVGSRSTGSVQWFGNIGPIYIGQRQLSASEMQAITA